MALPKLKKHDNQTLFDFYCKSNFVTAKEISETFKISKTGANKIMNVVFEHMARNDMESPVKTGKYIPTNIMFDVYGINIEDVIERLKLEKAGND